MKFKYKYVIYKVYKWTLHKKGDTPIANTIFTLGIVHFFQILTILYFVDRVIVPLNWLDKIDKVSLFMGIILYFILVYLIIYNKERWNNYLKEYGDESEKDRRRGSRMVIAYLIGSILIFFISLPLLFAIGKFLNK